MKKCNYCLFLLKFCFEWVKLQVHSYCSSKDMRGQSFALSQWKIAKISKPYGIQRVKEQIRIFPMLITEKILRILQCILFKMIVKTCSWFHSPLFLFSSIPIITVPPTARCLLQFSTWGKRRWRSGNSSPSTTFRQRMG